MKLPSTLLACLLIAVRMTACTAGHPARDSALVYLQSDNAVTVTKTPVADWDNASYYLFKPNGTEPTRGFIIYGGASIEPEAYAPAAYGIAAEGHLAALVKMPMDTSLLAPERAALIIAALPAIETWAIGGHSMGGIAACAFARNNPDLIDAVILWASHPSEANRLDESALAALSISAENDGIYPPDVIQASAEHLPEDTQWVEIEGGNHYQFGWYEDDHQPIDGDATITLEQQTAEIVTATVQFMDNL